MAIEDPHEELEKMVIKDMDAVVCEFDDCILRGSYYKCYYPSHKQCVLYSDWEKTRNQRDKKSKEKWADFSTHH